MQAGDLLLHDELAAKVVMAAEKVEVILAC